MKHLERDVRDIVLCVDFSDTSVKAFHAAVRAARLFEARLHIVHVNEEEAVFGAHGSRDLSDFLENVAMKRLEWLGRLEGIAQAAGIEARALTRTGAASQAILSYSDEVGASLVVLGWVGANVSHHVLAGSTASQILRKASLPTLVVPFAARVQPAAAGGTFNHILYPTDLTETSRRGLAVARRMAAHGAALTLLHVVRFPTMVPALPGEPPVFFPIGLINDPLPQLRAELESVAGELDVKTTCSVEVSAGAAEGIAVSADREGADLIVLPRHSRRGIGSYIFGRTAERLVPLAPAPVLLFSPE